MLTECYGYALHDGEHSPALKECYGYAVHHGEHSPVLEQICRYVVYYAILITSLSQKSKALRANLWCWSLFALCFPRIKETDQGHCLIRNTPDYDELYSTAYSHQHRLPSWVWVSVLLSLATQGRINGSFWGPDSGLTWSHIDISKHRHFTLKSWNRMILLGNK